MTTRNPHDLSYKPRRYGRGMSTAGDRARHERAYRAKVRAAVRTRAIEDRITAEGIRELHADDLFTD